MLTQDDIDLIELSSSSASLDASPRKNWVENAGGLPPYVRKLARGIMKSGKSKEQAIAIAISRIKKWAAGGGDVDADTRAKSAKAVAQWEKAKAKNKAKNLVKMSYAEGDYIMLAYGGSYNTDTVRSAWDAQERVRRQAYEKTNRSSSDMAVPASEMYPYRWVREVWSDFIIIEDESPEGRCYHKIPYYVEHGEVEFGEGVEVEQIWATVGDEDDYEDELNETERELLGDVLTVKLSRLQTIIDIVKG